MPVKSELIELIERVSNTIALPPISRVYIPEPDPSQEGKTQFGIVVLEDGSAGLYYAWMGESQQGMQARYKDVNFQSQHPLTLARYFNSGHEADRSLGLATINAITQHTFRLAGFTPERAASSMGDLELCADDHLGMVGYFPTLVERLRKRRINLTVIEKKPAFLGKDEGVNVTADPAALNHCNKILLTATTLLNDTIDEVLGHCHHAQRLAVIGPTAGFFPDPLFKRGITAIGGTGITDAGNAILQMQSGLGLGETATKYMIKRADYPGVEHLLKLIQTK